MARETLPEPWRSFLRELDARCSGEVRPYCIGGFVVTLHYGLARPASDVDILAVFILPRRGRKALPGITDRNRFGLYFEAEWIQEPHTMNTVPTHVPEIGQTEYDCKCGKKIRIHFYQGGMTSGARYQHCPEDEKHLVPISTVWELNDDGEWLPIWGAERRR